MYSIQAYYARLKSEENLLKAKQKIILSKAILYSDATRSVYSIYRVTSKEKRLLEEIDCLINGINQLLQGIMGTAPWNVAWKWKKGTSYVDIARLMAEAARSNCPVTTSFLRRARAWPFFSDAKSVSALHAALDAQHWKMAKLLVRNLDACPYVADTRGRRPTDLMPPEMREQLEKVSRCACCIFVCLCL